MGNESTLLTVKQVATTAGVTRQAVLAAIERGALSATKVGEDGAGLWLVSPVAAEEWAQRSKAHRSKLARKRRGR